MRKGHEQFVRELRREAPRLSAKSMTTFDWLREPYADGFQDEQEDRARSTRERHQNFVKRMLQESGNLAQLLEETACDENGNIENDGEESVKKELWKEFSEKFDEIFGLNKNASGKK